MATELSRQKAAQAWCKESTKGKEMDSVLCEAFAEILDEIWSKPWLGNATTGEMLDEIKARVDCSYKTVGGAHHDHSCHCGTASVIPHQIGTAGCVREMTGAPNPHGKNEELGYVWEVDGLKMCDSYLRQKRGYHQHPCGCWSRSPGSEKSIYG